MWALKVGATFRLLGDVTQAREYGTRAAAAYEPIARQLPDDPQQQELWGRALALAGRCADAVAAGERSLRARLTVVDQANGPYYRYQVARIDIQCGQYDRALDLLEEIVATPSQFTPAWLHIDPIFTELAGHPRFARLLQRAQ